MKTSRFIDAQIMAILRQAEDGIPVAELCREHGMSDASFYKWRARLGGMDASMVAQMKSMEDENRRLKKMYAELSMQNDLLKEALGKSAEAVSTQGALRQMQAIAYRPRDGHASRSESHHQRGTRLPDVLDQRDVLS